MQNRDLDDILASLRSALDGVACFKSILKKHGGLWFDPIGPMYLFGVTGSGPTATIAVVDWMMKVQKLRDI